MTANKTRELLAAAQERLDALEELAQAGELAEPGELDIRDFLVACLSVEVLSLRLRLEGAAKPEV